MDQLVRSIYQAGNAVRRQRRKLGLTQAQLSDLTGLRQATISALEASENGARLKTLLDVLASLELELVIRPRSEAPKIEDVF